MLAGMKGVKIGNAIDAKNDRLAMDYETLLPVLERRLNDPGIAPWSNRSRCG
jgi:hypothetical protein